MLFIRKEQMMNKQHVINCLNLIMLTVLYFAANLIVFNRDLFSLNVITLRYTLVAIASIYFLLVYLLKYFKRNGSIHVFKLNDKIVFIIWVLFSGSVIISEVINGELPTQGLSYTFINSVFFFFIIPTVLKDNLTQIWTASFLSSALVIFMSVFTVPITFGRAYAGVTHNPNSLGQISTQGAIAITSIFLARYFEKKTKIQPVYIVLILSFISIILLTYSRSSLIAYTVVVLFYTLLLLHIRKVKSKRTIALITIILIIFFVFNDSIITEGFLIKFDKYNYLDNTLSGRNYIWGSIISEIKIFGHGNSYFSKLNQGAHNSILFIVGQYGLISGMLMILFYFSTVFVSIKYAYKNRNHAFSLLPFAFILTFILISMAEGMFGSIGKGMTLIYYNVIGVCMYNYGNQKREELDEY